MSNIAGSPDPQMLEIEALDFKIRIWKLLAGRLDLPELNITKPTLILEKDESGAKNWDLPALSKGNAAANAALPDSRDNFPLIGMMNISDGTLVYRDKLKGLDLKLTIDTVKGDSSSEKNQFLYPVKVHCKTRNSPSKPAVARSKRCGFQQGLPVTSRSWNGCDQNQSGRYI